MEIKNKYQLYLNVVSYSGDTFLGSGITATTINSDVNLFFGVLGSDNVVRNFYDKDFYINIPLFRTFKIEEYVDVKQEENIQTLERQQFNPYFIELSFFDSVRRNKVNHGNELSRAQINYIKTVRPDVENQNIINWFEEIGRSELPWFKGSLNEITINDISMIQSNDKSDTLSIVGKSVKYPIEINS